MTNWLQARMVRGLIAGCAALCVTSVAAQPMQRGFVALGGAVGPDYSGSSDYRVLPFAAARLSFAGVTFESEGLGGRLNLSQTRGFGYGPSFRFRFGRDDSVENDQVAELEEIDEAFEIGGFVRIGRPIGLTRGDVASLSVEVLGDVAGGHSGVVGRVSAAYTMRPAQRLGLTLATSATIVSEAFNDTYFSVSDAGSAASGLDAFTAEGGLNNVGLSAIARYQVTERWGVTGLVSVSRLLGDAADSPVVDDVGSPTQVFGGLGISYSF